MFKEDMTNHFGLLFIGTQCIYCIAYIDRQRSRIACWLLLCSGD